MNVKDLQTGRLSGMELALKIAREGGIEALEKEMEFRARSGVNAPVSMKDLDIASTKIKEMTIDTMTTLAVAAVHDEFGFGQKRCQRLVDRMNRIAGSLADEMATWDDYTQMIKDEMGITLTIRWNN